MTERLYLSDSYLTQFRARVLRSFPFKGRLAVVLNQTAFYPEGGGQPGDRGTLGVVPVVDTQESNDEVLHLVDAANWTTEDVDGAIDWNRRFDHIQQHHGQHLLSAAFQRIHGAATVSFHLGEILYDRPRLLDRQTRSCCPAWSGVGRQREHLAKSSGDRSGFCG